jgi:hypothetical protein
MEKRKKDKDEAGEIVVMAKRTPAAHKNLFERAETQIGSFTENIISVNSGGIIQ